MCFIICSRRRTLSIRLSLEELGLTHIVDFARLDQKEVSQILFDVSCRFFKEHPNSRASGLYFFHDQEFEDQPVSVSVVLETEVDLEDGVLHIRDHHGVLADDAG